MNREYLEHVIYVKESLQVWYANLEQYHNGVNMFSDDIDLDKKEMDFGKWYYGEGQFFESFETFKNLEPFYDEMFEYFVQYKTLAETPIKKGFFSNNEAKQKKKLDTLIVEIKQSTRKLIKSVEIFEDNLRTSPLFEDYQTLQKIEATDDTNSFDTFEDLLEANQTQEVDFSSDREEKLDTFLDSFDNQETESDIIKEETTENIEDQQIFSKKTIEEELEIGIFEAKSTVSKDSDKNLDDFLKNFENQTLENDTVIEEHIETDFVSDSTETNEENILDVEQSELIKESSDSNEGLDAFLKSFETQERESVVEIEENIDNDFIPDNTIEIRDENIVEMQHTEETTKSFEEDEKYKEFIKSINSNESSLDEIPQKDEIVIVSDEIIESTETKKSVEATEDYQAKLQAEIEKVKKQLKEEYEEKLKKLVNDKHDIVNSKKSSNKNNDSPDIDIDEEIRRILS